MELQGFYSNASWTNSSHTALSSEMLAGQQEGHFGVVPKTIPHVIGEYLLRPALDLSINLSSRAIRILQDITYTIQKVNKVFSFPSAYALKSFTIQEIRQIISGLEDAVQLEDVFKRITSDTIGVIDEPADNKKSYNDLIMYIGTISNPANFYENLVLSGLEKSAVENLKKLAEMKRVYDNNLDNHLKRKDLEDKIQRLKNKKTEVVANKQTATDNETAMIKKAADINTELTTKNTEYQDASDKYKTAQDTINTYETFREQFQNIRTNDINDLKIYNAAYDKLTRQSNYQKVKPATRKLILDQLRDKKRDIDKVQLDLDKANSMISFLDTQIPLEVQKRDRYWSESQQAYQSILKLNKDLSDTNGEINKFADERRALELEEIQISTDIAQLQKSLRDEL